MVAVALPFDDDPEYVPFPGGDGRDWAQSHLELPLLAVLLALPRHARTLEVGCGGGNALPAISRLCQPATLTGVDVDASLLERARRRLDEAGVTARLEIADLRRLPFVDASLDLVFDFGTCYHIALCADGLREIARVMAPGAVLVHETRLSQALCHPVRSFGRHLPWAAVPELRPLRHAGLWATRRKA
jgi:ubiquinone/menaquinone biosynthesis C-methylase UbiE